MAKKSASNKLLRGSSLIGRALFTSVFIFFVVYAALLIYPLLWSLVSSVKTVSAYYDESALKYIVKGKLLSELFDFKNYIYAFQRINVEGQTFFSMLWNSSWFAAGSAFITVEFTTAFAYILNKYKFRGRNLLFGLALFMISVPIGASFISTYRLMHMLRITNSYFILLTATNVYGMSLLLMHSFMSSISWSYAEAAQIDGANFYTVYFKVMRSQAAPMMITMFVLAFISKWNDYLSPMLYLSKMLTLSSGLFRYQTIVERTGNYPVLFAGLTISTIPIMIVYAIFNQKLMGNFSIGGLKG